MTGVVELFDSIAAPPTAPEGERFAVRSVGRYSCQIGKSSDGEPALLIPVPQLPLRDRPASIVLEHVRVQHDIDCLTYHPDGEVRTGRFTIISCLDSDRALKEYFLRSLSPVVLQFEVPPSRTDVVNAINTLVELFKCMARPQLKSIQGLWGELFLISQSRDPGLVLSAWHATPQDRYDFSSGIQRVEVKSASRGKRIHHFALEQVRPPAQSQVLVASLYVERSTGGPSILDLADEISANVRSNARLLLHLDRVLRESLGAAWRLANEDRFDRELAIESLRFFGAEDVPAVSTDVPKEVSDVHFQADLSGVQPVVCLQYSSRGGLFEALC